MDEAQPLTKTLGVDQTLDNIQRTTRRAMLVMLSLGSVGATFGIVVRMQMAGDQPLDRYMEVSVPTFAVSLISLTLLLWRRPASSNFVQHAMMTLLCTHLTINLALLLFTLPSKTDSLRELSTFNYWIPIAFVMMFVLFKRESALRFALTFYTVLAAVAGAYLLRHSIHPSGLDPSVDSFLVTSLVNQFFISHAMYIAMLVVFGRFKEAVWTAERNAQRLAKIAHSDALTGLMNRRGLTLVLEEAALRAQSSSAGQLSLVLIDLDHFKAVNDRHGHDAGDAVLKEFAKVLTKHCRASDAVGRWGGEEFLVVLPGCAATKAMTIAETLCQAVRETEFAKSEPITASFGVAEVRNGESVSDAMIRTDDALYASKHAGRDRATMAT